MILGPQNKPSGVVKTFNDVTDEREIDRMKSEFISTAAHELRTPLTSIRGYSEIMLSMDAFSAEDQKKFLSYINRKSIHMGAIIDDMFHIAQMESAQAPILNKASHKLDDFIRTTVSFFQQKFSEFRFEITRLPNDSNVIMDREKIEQVFSRLVDNAVKFSPDGGVIKIAVQPAEEHLAFSIQDQGIGIPSNSLEKVFDKFYRLDASNTALEGTGLGLTLVKYFVEAHGGRVWLESEPGKGTTVNFTIPV